MPKSIVHTIITVTLIICGFLIGTGAAIANSSIGQTKLSVTAAYYKSANDIVNAQFKDLFLFFKGLDIKNDNYLELIQDKLSPPVIDMPIDQLNEFCLSNLSSSCLQHKLKELYINYSTTMQNSSDGSSPASASSLEDAVNITSSPDRFYAEQDNVIREINRSTIDFYRQVVFSYPLHIQNEKIFNNLKELLNNLQDLEEELEPYSYIFHNATTAECT